MGTHCHIGIERKDGTVEYIYIHFDGYFSGIVPILREYKEREDVEKLIKRGSDALCRLSELNNEYDFDNIREDNQPRITRSIYRLLDVNPRVSYVYVFTRENQWVCQSILPYINMTDLKYYYENYEKNDNDI